MECNDVPLIEKKERGKECKKHAGEGKQGSREYVEKKKMEVKEGMQRETRVKKEAAIMAKKFHCTTSYPNVSALT